MRLIDADEAYKVLTDYYNHKTEIQHKALKEAIGRVPSVDADPVKHGHWIDINENGSLWECSICGDRSCCSGNYCMECGAKMNEVEE